MAELGDDLIDFCIRAGFQGKALVLGTLEMLPGGRRHKALVRCGTPADFPAVPGRQGRKGSQNSLGSNCLGKGSPHGAPQRPPGSTRSSLSSSWAPCGWLIEGVALGPWALWGGWGESGHCWGPQSGTVASGLGAQGRKMN